MALAAQEVRPIAGHWDRQARQALRRDEGREQETARAVQHRQPIGKDKRVTDGAGPRLTSPILRCPSRSFGISKAGFERRFRTVSPSPCRSTTRLMSVWARGPA